jgi:hypothetical protein
VFVGIWKTDPYPSIASNRARSPSFKIAVNIATPVDQRIPLRLHIPIVAPNDLTRIHALVAAAISSNGIAAWITSMGVEIEKPIPNEQSESSPVCVATETSAVKHA